MSDCVPTAVDSLKPYASDEMDRAFICFGSPESRSLGTLRRSSGYTAGVVCIIGITDEPNADRDANLEEARQLGSGVGKVFDIPAQHVDPLIGLDHLANAISESDSKSGVVTVDISTFPKNSLLVTLKSIEMVEGVKMVRVVYTEPTSYSTSSHQSHSFGLRRTRVVPTFSAPFRANRELVLVMQLGYEGDRALGIWQRIQPHRTIVALGRPAYRPDWENVSERINSPLLSTLQSSDIHYVDPRNPWSTYRFLESVVGASSAESDNYFIAPLGTKPEAVGAYLFSRAFPHAATVIYAAPVDRNHQYIAKGIGPTWNLAEWTVDGGLLRS